MAHLDDPVYTPGERGRAWRNWRKLRAVVRCRGGGAGRGGPRTRAVHGYGNKDGSLDTA